MLMPSTTARTDSSTSPISTATSSLAPPTNFSDPTWACFSESETISSASALKVRPNTNAIPNCWEWGTLNHECIAGITACVEYLADLGRRVNPSASTRRTALLAAYEAIQKHEH